MIVVSFFADQRKKNMVFNISHPQKHFPNQQPCVSVRKGKFCAKTHSQGNQPSVMSQRELIPHIVCDSTPSQLWSLDSSCLSIKSV